MFLLVVKKFLLAPLCVSTSGKKVFTGAIMCLQWWEKGFYRRHYISTSGKKVLQAPLCVFISGTNFLQAPLCVSTGGKKGFTGAIMCFH